MWGWKTVERSITPAVGPDRASEILGAFGFVPRLANKAFIILSKEDPAIEAAVAQTETGVFLQLRYGQFVIYDGGHLVELANQLASLLTPSSVTTDA